MYFQVTYWKFQNKNGSDFNMKGSWARFIVASAVYDCHQAGSASRLLAACIYAAITLSQTHIPHWILCENVPLELIVAMILCNWWLHFSWLFPGLIMDMFRATFCVMLVFRVAKHKAPLEAAHIGLT